MAAVLVACIASQVIMARQFGSLGSGPRATWSVIAPLCGLLIVPTAALLVVGWSTRSWRADGRIVAAIAMSGLLMRLPYFGVGQLLEDDHFRYLLDGAIVAHGLNPYAYSPQQVLAGAVPEPYRAIGVAGRAAIEQINFPQLRSIYPGTGQVLYAIAHLIKPWSIGGLRVVLLASELATALLCWHLLGALGMSRHLVALIWCNPLLAFCLTGQAHVDAALGPLVLGAVVAMWRAWSVPSGALLGLAIGVKLWPAMLLPLFLRYFWPNRRAALGCLLSAAVVASATCVPVLISSANPNAGLVAYARGWSVNNMPYAWASYTGLQLSGGNGLEAYLRVGVGLAAIVLSLAVAVRPIQNNTDHVARLALVAGGLFYLSPAQFPWYAFWFLPLAVLARNWALLAASAALPFYFLFFPLAGTPLGDLHRYWLSGLHLLPVIIVALLMRRLPEANER